MDNVIKFRERLGWKIEIFRYVMGCKDVMEKLKNLFDNEKVSKIMYFLRFSFFVFMYLFNDKYWFE